MPDDSLEILVRMTADTSGGSQVKESLKEVTGATQASVPATEGATKATEKLKFSHRELHMALAQLGPEFAHIGGMAQYALHNQMLAPVLGLVGAFALWEHRIKACVVALGGVELPDNAKEQLGQIGALAESWRTFNKSLMDAATAYDSVDGASKRTIETLKAEEEQKNKLLEVDKKLELSELERQKTLLTTAEYEAKKAEIENRYEQQSAEDDDEAQNRKLQAKAKRGADLVESSKKKMAEAGKIKLGTPEQEAAIDEQMGKQAEAAEKSKAERAARIKDIFDFKDHIGSLGERVARFARLVGRYGLLDTRELEGGGVEALTMEQEGGKNEQIVIDRYQQRMKGKAIREEQQDRRKKLVADAGKEAGEAYQIWQEGPGDVAAYRRSVDNRRAIAATNSQAQWNLADAKTLESPEANLIRDVSQAEATLQHGGQISAAQGSQIKALAQQMKQSHIEQGDAIITALGTVHNTASELTKRVLELTRRINTMQAQHRDTFNQ